MRLDSKTWPQTAMGGSNGNAAILHQGEKINVLVAHADAIVNAGLAALLGASADIAVRSASVPDDAFHCGAADVVIVDHKGALEHMRRRADAQHGQVDQLPRVLIVTQLDREWEVRTACLLYTSPSPRDS